jgi:hypothetical protein
MFIQLFEVTQNNIEFLALNTSLDQDLGRLVLVS